MIRPGDLARSARVQVLDGYRRPWWRLFRRTPIYRTVWMGFIERWEQDLYAGASLTLVDATTRLERYTVQGVTS